MSETRHTPGPWEVERSAALIAAAPDLFEACVEMVRIAYEADYAHDYRQDKDEGELYPEFAQAEAAIKKARGDLPQSKPLEKGDLKQ